MDELMQRRYVRRLALVVALTCAGPSLCADQTRNETSSFRSLIVEGWDDDGRSPLQKQPTDTPFQDGLNLSASIESRSSTAIETIEQQIDVAAAIRSPVANAQAVRLRESARLSLQKSQQSLERRATHSATMYAKESLRAVVAMQDVGQGGTAHARALNLAMDAIRESRDFAVCFGVMDQASLARLVTVHKTRVLKGRNLEHVSAIEATEFYLNFARVNLVQAAGNAREASDALTILGRVERETASPDNSHALAVAMQQAAVEIAPQSMLAHRELGITFSRQGLVDLAAESLIDCPGQQVEKGRCRTSSVEPSIDPSFRPQVRNF